MKLVNKYFEGVMILVHNVVTLVRVPWN